MARVAATDGVSLRLAGKALHCRVYHCRDCESVIVVEFQGCRRKQQSPFPFVGHSPLLVPPTHHKRCCSETVNRHSPVFLLERHLQYSFLESDRALLAHKLAPRLERKKVLCRRDILVDWNRREHSSDWKDPRLLVHRGTCQAQAIDTSRASNTSVHTALQPVPPQLPSKCCNKSENQCHLLSLVEKEWVVRRNRSL